jgi:phospholipase/lecithinase/hemolysin
MNITKLTAVAMLATVTLASPAHADRDTGQYTSITVLGDSLVDAGNIFAATGGATPSAALGYFQGRFTNGYDYTDLLSIRLYGTPTRPSLLGGTNFAYGGARVVANSDFPLDLNAQLAAVQQRGNIDVNGLYVLNFGGNDIFNAASAAAGLGISVNQYLALAANQYAQGVQTLNNLGARNILVTGFPVATDNNSFIAEAAFTAALNNLTLDSDTDLFRFSYLDFFNRLLTNPTSLGFPGPLNTTDNCIALGLQAQGCPGLFSFDGTHPVAAVQTALFNDINRQFQLVAVPEPATWGMMILGFGLVGAAMRRTRGEAAVAA